MNKINAQKIAEQVVDNMFDNDAFSQWLGIKRISEKPGQSKLCLKVRNDMLNGFGIAHGGITYSLADSALAFASNSHGKKSVSVETSISHTISVQSGDTLTAEAKELHCSRKIGVYDIRITNQNNEEVAFFKGTVYRTSKDWLE